MSGQSIHDRAITRIEQIAKDRRARFAIENPEIAFVANELIQCTLPHNNPGADVTTYTRTNGQILLMVDSGKDPYTKKPYGIPYGTIPRLLLYYIVTEAVRTKSRRIEFGRNLADFMRSIGLNPRTGRGERSDYRRMVQQATRLFNATIAIVPAAETEQAKREIPPRLNMPITDTQDLWWSSASPTSNTIFESYIELGERFFDAVMRSPVPVSLDALKQLKGSSLALDLYGWATYRTFLVKRSGKPTTIPMFMLREQFGADYSDQKEFNRYLRKALLKVKSVYPGFTYDDTSNPGHLIIFPAEPHIQELPI
jgi:hypothetical protein